MKSPLALTALAVLVVSNVVVAEHSSDRFERHRRHESLAARELVDSTLPSSPPSHSIARRCDDDDDDEKSHDKTKTKSKPHRPTQSHHTTSKSHGHHPSSTAKPGHHSPTSCEPAKTITKTQFKTHTDTVTKTKTVTKHHGGGGEGHETSTVTVTRTETILPTSSSYPTSPSYPVPTGNSTCAPDYKPTKSKAIYIDGTGTLPKPTSFVKKEKDSVALTLDGAPFRMVGPNMYWLCEDENVEPKGSWTSKTRIREALAIAVSMGANTIRALSCASSVGNSSVYHLKPTLDTWNEEAWDVRDYVIHAASEYGLRVVLTLSGNYDGPHGGKYTWLRWLNVSEENKGSLFYHEPKVIAAFKEYVETIVSHKNPYTGKTYGEDETVIGWETGNEWGGYINIEEWPPANWTDAIIDSIKLHSKHQLMIDGTNGFWNYTTKVAAPSLNVTRLDIVQDHGISSYPRNVPLLETEIPLAANVSKNIWVGEYDWTTNTDKDTLTDYLALIESSKTMGDSIWSIQGHDDECCKFVNHEDGYSLYYPNGNLNKTTGALDAGAQANILAVVQHWYRVTGRDIPSELPGVACPQPEF
ncbi:hypothetical protein JCM16303_000915 [Sporobolomyces ruberrimus]